MAFLQVSYQSAVLRRTVPFWVYLPSGSMEDVMQGKDPFANRQPFPTLYLLHGIFGDCTDWMMQTRVQQYADAHRLAVVCPSGENGFYTDNKNSNFYAQYIGQELVKATRYMFNLSDKREETYIAGLSMGGYGALRIGLNYCDTFSVIGAFSAALVMDRVLQAKNGTSGLMGMHEQDYYENIFGDVHAITNSTHDYKALSTACKNLPRVYIACGSEDMLVAPNREYHQFLQDHDITHTYEEWAGVHDFVFWDAAVKRFIEWL